jgi:hypothetical protein
MCMRSGESIDHLLLHCPVARELWCFIFNLFGVQLVMPQGAMELLACWRGGYGKSNEIWRAIPHCLFWCIWRKRNAKCFEGREQQLLDMKWTVLHTLMDWMVATRILDFLDFVLLNLLLVGHFICILLVYWGLYLFLVQ